MPSIVERVRELVSRLSVGLDCIAGSREERLVVERIRGFLEEYAGVRAGLIPIPVLTWRDLGGSVVCGDGVFEATVLPQTIGGSVDGRLVFFDSIDALEDAEKRVVEDSVVILEMPVEFDEVQTAYMLALEKEASGVVFYDPFPGRRRRIVVTGRWDYSLRSPAPGLIPAVHVERRIGLHLVKHCSGQRVRLETRVDIRRSTGYIVEALIDAKKSGGSSGYWEILVTAHHDYWLSGANDNLAGVALGLLLATDYARAGEGAGAVRLVSFTAEELGDPLMPSWYWAYGSRWYAEYLSSAGLVDEVVALLNVDVAGTPNPLLYATPELRSLFEGQGLTYAGVDHSYTDSYSFAGLGLPRATVMNLEEWREFYHTDLDRPEKLNSHGLVRVYNALRYVLQRLAREGWSGLDYAGFARTVYEKLRRAGPLAASRGYMLVVETDRAIRRKDYDVLRRAFRRLSSRAIRAVFDGDYRFDEGGFVVDLFPQLRILDDMKTLVGGGEANVASSRVLPGSEEVTYTLVSWHPTRLRDHARRVAELYMTDAVQRAALEAADIVEDAYMFLLRSRLERGQ